MPVGADLAERVAHARRLVLAGGHDHLGAGHFERVGRKPRRGARDHHRERQVGGAAHEIGVERQARLGVEHDPARLAVRAVDAHGQQRIVGERGADPDRHRVALGAPVVREPARGLARDPLRVARAGGDLAVERHRRLEEHEGAAGAGVLAERLVEQPRPGGQLTARDHHLDALVAQDAEAAAGRLLGRVVGADDHAGDPGLRGSPRCTAGSARGGSTARARRRAWRRAGRALQAASASRSAWAAPYAVWKPSPSTSPSLTTTAPTSGLGVVRPRPPSASSIARARWATSA